VSLSSIEQIISVKLLGIHLTYVEHILSVANQRLHLFGLLKYPGLSSKALHQIFTAIVQSVITYALPYFAGQLSKGDKSRINALFRKAVKRGLCHTSIEIDELIDTADKRLFRHMSKKTHCLHHLPPQCNVHTAFSLRNRGHNFTLPHTDFNLYKNSLSFLYLLSVVFCSSFFNSPSSLTASPSHFSPSLYHFNLLSYFCAMSFVLCVLCFVYTFTCLYISLHIGHYIAPCIVFYCTFVRLCVCHIHC